MSSNVQSGVLQIGIAIGLLYAFWSGALAVLLEGLTVAVRGEPGDRGSLFAAATAGRSGRAAAAAEGA